MRDGVSGVFDGLPELRAKLRTLSDDAQFNGGRFAGRKAANVLREAMAREAASIDDPQTSESIERNLAVRFSSRTFKRSGDIKYRVGVRGGAASRAKNQSNPGGDTFYWRFLNFGTQKIGRQMSLERAAQQSESEVFQTFRKQYEKAIDRAIKRARKNVSTRISNRRR
jgi:HK97 gp10 family phage protein